MYGGTYTADAKGALTLSQVIATLRACADANTMAGEARYFTALQTVSAYKLDGAQVQLVFAGGEGLLTFAPVQPAPGGTLPGMPTTGAGRRTLARRAGRPARGPRRPSPARLRHRAGAPPPALEQPLPRAAGRGVFGPGPERAGSRFPLPAPGRGAGVRPARTQGSRSRLARSESRIVFPFPHREGGQGGRPPCNDPPQPRYPTPPCTPLPPGMGWAPHLCPTGPCGQRQHGVSAGRRLRVAGAAERPGARGGRLYRGHRRARGAGRGRAHARHRRL